ncbi:hypothetical protein HRbin28_00452 [bacterium HR28]|uniref:DUF4870 domain-containing protein n=1 Tax=Thermomicrobium roseum TaxID=500 RepID=A0A7C2B4W6_THERO|nr:hypothetical protein HRbin28_00452 [bacterium HR28]
MNASGTAQTPNQPTGPSFAHLQPSSDNDRLLAALGYIFWIVVPAIVLLTDLRRSVFAYVHALQGLVFGGASILFLILYTCVTTVLSAIVPPLACILWLGYLLPLALGIYYAYRAYTIGQTEFPLLSDVTRSLFRQQLAGILG